MIQAKHNLPDFVKEIVVTPEIDAPYEYKEILLEIGQITDGLLNIQEVNIPDPHNWNIEIDIEGKILSLQVTRKFFDNNILYHLNEIIVRKKHNEKRRLVNLHGNFYDSAIAFITPANEYELFSEGLIWRSGGWKADYEKFKIYDAYNILELKEDITKVSLPECWIGYFKYERDIEFTLFRLLITDDEDGNIRGRIYEGMDCLEEKPTHITFEGKRSDDKITFIKSYNMRSQKHEIMYSGRISKSCFASGVWINEKMKKVSEVVDVKNQIFKGTWEMKLIVDNLNKKFI